MTIKQVEGKHGVMLLRRKLKASGPCALYQGGLAAFFASLIGHYPWFCTYNYLQRTLPAREGTCKFVREAQIGFCSSVIADCISNAFHVVKVCKQASGGVVTYPQAIKK